MRRLLVVAVALLVGLMVTSVVQAEPRAASAAKASATPPAGTKGTISATKINKGSPVFYQWEVTVSATKGWQDLDVRVTKGDTIFYSWVRGKWTVDARNFPEVGPEGYPPHVDRQIYQGCKFDATQPYARLVSSVSAHRTWLGPGGHFDAPSTGTLYFHIHDHDDCLGDNAGSVTMRLDVHPMLDRSCETVQATDRAKCLVALRPHVSSTKEEQFERFIGREVANIAKGAGCLLFDVPEQAPASNPRKGGVVLVKCVAKEVGLHNLAGLLRGKITSAYEAFLRQAYP